MNENIDIRINDLVNDTNIVANELRFPMLGPYLNIQSSYFPMPAISLNIREELERRADRELSDAINRQFIEHVQELITNSQDRWNVDLDTQTLTSRNGYIIKSGIIKSTDGEEYVVDLVLRKKCSNKEPLQRQILV